MALFSQKATDKLLQGFRRKDRYRILGRIAEGRFTEVMNCFDTFLNRYIAVKRLKHEFLDDSQRVLAFVNETRLVSYLDHPGLVSVHDFFLAEGGEPAYAMKLVDGGSLAAAVKAGKVVRPLEVFTKLCETLAFAHDRGVVHLHLSPDNVLLGPYGEVMITGWGSAYLFDKRPYEEYVKLVRDVQDLPLEQEDVPVALSPSFMSPEQIHCARRELTPSSDIFSLGAILYWTMAGVLPFRGRSHDELVEQVRSHTPPPMHELNGEVPHRLSLICGAMMQKDPFQRYHSFHEILIDLDNLKNSGQAFGTVAYNPGDVIFREGEDGNTALTVASGHVEVIKQVGEQYVRLALLGKDESVGELSIFTGEKRTATVRACDPNTVVRVMSREAVEQELQKLSPWVGRMITGLSKRFIDMNEKVAHSGGAGPEAGERPGDAGTR